MTAASKSITADGRDDRVGERPSGIGDPVVELVADLAPVLRRRPQMRSSTPRAFSAFSSMAIEATSMSCVGSPSGPGTGIEPSAPALPVGPPKSLPLSTMPPPAKAPM